MKTKQIGFTQIVNEDDEIASVREVADTPAYKEYAPRIKVKNFTTEGWTWENGFLFKNVDFNTEVLLMEIRNGDGTKYLRTSQDFNDGMPL